MPLRGASHYRARSIAVALVVGAHGVLLALLATQRGSDSDLADERMTLVFIDPLEAAHLPRPVNRPTQAARNAQPPFDGPAPSPAPAANESAAITPGIDWYANGSDAARRAAAEPTTRSFDFPMREPKPVC